LDIPFSRNTSVLENEALSLQLRNTFTTGSFTFKITPQLLINYRLNIPWQIVKWSEPTNTLPGTFSVSQHQGKRFKLLMTAEQVVSQYFQHSLALYLQNTLSGDQRYHAY